MTTPTAVTRHVTGRATAPAEGKDAASTPVTQVNASRPKAEYLTISRSPSLRVSTASRKLLILDLNGTLLLRDPPRRGYPGRPVYLRAYMPTFRSFLFHEAVKPWLEVRVWSSAQSHSVDSMVTRCFANRRHDLKAVWARDTLGLSSTDYSRKVQTVKDLEKHWSANLGGCQHSAETTLLVDDSPLKAYLQPYNHCCIPEYTQNLRDRDVNTKSIELRETARKKAGINVTQHRNAQSSLISTAETGFDQTLIALIGILDEVRGQTNVAGWIRAGGLWAGQELSLEELTSSLKLSDPKVDVSRKPGGSSEPRKEPLPLENDAGAQRLHDTPVWFDTKPCLQYWVDRGTRAVQALGINLEDGISR